MKKYTSDNTSDPSWVLYLDEADVPDEYVGMVIETILKRSDAKIRKILRTLPENLTESKKLCYGKAKVYCERMTLKEPIFESLIEMQTDEDEDEMSPIVPETLGFNLNFASTRYEFLNQTYGRGNGITDMWCYLKV